MKKVLLILLSFLVIGAGATFVLTKGTLNGKSVSESAGQKVPIENFINNEVIKMNNFVSSAVITDTSYTSQRLSGLGFTAANGNKITPEIHNISLLLSEYKRLYPNKTFVNFKIVSDLLDKYDLSFGTTDRYIGEVPEHAIADMEVFKPLAKYSRSWMMRDGAHRTPKEMSKNLYGFNSLENFRSSIAEESIISDKVMGTKAFYIIAPKNKFSGEENAKGAFVDVKDPIVLYPVIGGYIIVTAW